VTIWISAFRRHSSWLVPAGFGLLAFLTRSHHPTFDAWRYSLQVEAAVRLGRGLADPELWHPHHLAYSPLGYLVLRATRPLVGPVPALVVLQFLSAASAAVCLWALARILRALPLGRDAAGTSRPGHVAAVLPLALSFAFWYYAGEAEVYLPALCFASAGVATLLGRPAAGFRIPAAAALFVASALMHQMMVLLALPLAVWWLASHVHSWRSGLLFALLWGGGTFLSYFLVWRLVVQPAGGDGLDFAGWVTYLVHSGNRELLGWGHLDLGTPGRALVGLARTVYGGHAVLALDPAIMPTLRRLVPGAFIVHELRVMDDTPRLVAWLAVSCTLASGAIWLAGAVRASRTRPARALPPDPARTGLLFGSWFLAMALFILWWEADNPEFWLLALPGLVMWMAVATRGRWHRLIYSLGLLTLLGAVAMGSIVPKAMGPQAREISLFARAAQLPGGSGGGRIWPGFCEAFLPEPPLRPLWGRMPAAAALDSLVQDRDEGHARVWILQDSVAFRHLAGRAVQIDNVGSWGVWSLATRARARANGDRRPSP